MLCAQELRGKLERQRVDLARTEEQVEDVAGEIVKLQKAALGLIEESEQWADETEVLRKREQETLDALAEFRRSGGPRTPRPQWDEVEESLAASDANLDTKQRSATIAEELGGFVATMRGRLAEAETAVLEAEEQKKNRAKDEEALRAVIAEEKAAVEARYSKTKWLVCEGTGPSVPVYLRATGKVRDLFMTKAEAEKIIKDCWETKVRSDARPSARPLPLAEFFAGWMKTRAGARAVEQSYNLVDAIERFGYDADCALFDLILRGELCEEVYYAEEKLIDGFEAALVAEDRKHSNPSVGTGLNHKLRRPEFLAVLQRYLGRQKTKEEMQALMRALAYDQPTPRVHYGRLFEESERADQGQFAEALRDQFLYSVQQSYISVEQSIREATLEAVASNGTRVPTIGPAKIAAHRVVTNSNNMKNTSILQKEALLIEGALLEYEPGQMVVVEGGVGSSMYLVISGLARAEKNGHLSLTEYRSGSIFGEQAAMEADELLRQGKSAAGVARRATITAHEKLLVLALDREALEEGRAQAAEAGTQKEVECFDLALGAVVRLKRPCISNQQPAISCLR